MGDAATSSRGTVRFLPQDVLCGMKEKFMTVSLMPMECLWPTVSPPTGGNCLPFPEVTVRRSAYQLWQQRTLFLNREEFPIFS